MSKYEGKICDVCCRPVTERDLTYRIPGYIRARRKFGDAPVEVRIYLDLKSITYGHAKESESDRSEGDICIECLRNAFKDYDFEPV